MPQIYLPKVADSPILPEIRTMFRAKTWLLWCLLLPFARVPAQAMPPGLPDLHIDWYEDTTMCDYIFLSNVRFVLPMTLSSAGMIFDRRGELVWYLPSTDNLYNFSPQPDGQITFNVNDTWYALDSSLMLNMLPTCDASFGDFHDLILLPNGHRFELCYGDTTMDLRSITTSSGQAGDSAANVRYNVIEERNALGQLLKRWRGIDHFSPADVDPEYFSFPWYLELLHTNSMDYDGQNLLLSHRSNHEVTLVDWASGQVKWRLGGNNSDFVYINDGGFKSQHDARFAGNNRISIFDNRSLGTVTTPRAVVYTLDTVLGFATKVYDRVESNSESPSMGSFRELPNGDGLVCWGQILPENRPNISYFHANGQKVCDWRFQDPHLTYRAMCSELPFDIDRPEIVCNQQNGNLVLNVQGTFSNYLWSSGETTGIIQAMDTGYYQVYVPSGAGFAGSNVLHITDLNSDCPSTPVDDPRLGGRPPKLVGTFDLLGRPIQRRQAGQIYLERYDNGLSRKVLEL